jgi:hypothetical protein
MWVYMQAGHIHVESHPDDPARLVVQFEVVEGRRWIDDPPDDMPETLMAVRVVAEGGSPPGLDATRIASPQPDVATNVGDSEENKAIPVWERLGAAFSTGGRLPTITPPIPLPPVFPTIAPPCGGKSKALLAAERNLMRLLGGQ